MTKFHRVLIQIVFGAAPLPWVTGMLEQCDAKGLQEKGGKGDRERKRGEERISI